MRHFCVPILALVTAALLSANDQVDQIKTPGKAVTFEPDTKVTPLDVPPQLFRNLLHKFSVTRESESSSSYIVSGTVTDNNSGIAMELVPISFASPLHGPKLAGMTNAFGEFRFRIWIKQENQNLRLETPKLEEGILYLGESPTGFISVGLAPKSVSSTAFAYAFRDLLNPPKGPGN